MTVIFDFDSTIVTCESLEKILLQNLEGQPDIAQKIAEITEAGIRGKITFAESLAERLRLAAPTKEQVALFGQQALQWITPGMEELIQDLHNHGMEVWIISGGIQETLMPVAKKLHIPESQVKGVTLLWDEEGDFAGIDPSDSFSRSKLEGAKLFEEKWESPKIMVGDAVSDYCLFAENVVDHFILFTEHFRCDELLDKGVPVANNINELQTEMYAFTR